VGKHRYLAEIMQDETVGPRVGHLVETIRTHDGRMDMAGRDETTMAKARIVTGEGLDPVQEATRLCIQLSRDYPRVVFFAGKLIWKRETWIQRILHNETAYQVERRLHWKGLAMSVLPVRVGAGERTAAVMSQGTR
jgi:hypothetical protein